MNPKYLIVAAALAHLFAPGTARAFEGEDGVPLSLGAVLGKVTVQQVSVSLAGREVEIATTLRNADARPHTAGFYARTAFFRQLGDGEMHADKTFADLTVSEGGKTVRAPGALRRGFFMGQDVTAVLKAAGIAPLPDLQVSEQRLARVRFPYGLKADDWEGHVSYAWVQKVAPGATARHTVRYRALPQFGSTTMSSSQFRQAVQAHCGNPDSLATELAKSGGAELVTLETYVLPIGFMQSSDVSLTVKQPALNWMQNRPVKALACGLTPSGMIEDAGKQLSVLVISLPIPLTAKGTADGR